MNYEEKGALLKEKGIEVYKFVNEKVVDPLRANLYVIKDIPSNLYSFMIQVVQDHQPKVIEYITGQYENVSVLLKDNWMKLDFVKNANLESLEELKQKAADVYDFIKNYNYIVKANEIKNTMYDEAIKFMKSDTHEESSE